MKFKMSYKKDLKILVKNYNIKNSLWLKFNQNLWP